MSKITYYEATGETRDRLREALAGREAAFRRLFAWAKRHGGKLATDESTWGLQVVLACDKPNEPENWELRRRDQPGFWTPKHTKRGKELAVEIKQIADGADTKCRFASILKLPPVDSDMTVPDVGVAEDGDRILLAVRCSTFKPGKNLKRISDLEYAKALGSEQ